MNLMGSLIRLMIVATTTMAVCSCATVNTRGNSPLASVTEGRGASSKVEQIVRRSLARCYQQVNVPDQPGTPVVTKISWSPPTNEDIATIKNLGNEAVPALASYFRTETRGSDFEQLIAIRFLGAIGTPETIPVFEGVLKSNDWQVVRLDALDFLGNVPGAESSQMIASVLDDEDPLISSRAKRLLELRRQPEEGLHISR